VNVNVEIAQWLSTNWDPELPLRRWWSLLAESGWGFPSWPENWCGRGLSARDTKTVRQEFSRRGVLGPPSGIGPFLAAPTLISHGTPEQLAKYMTGIADGSELWCQLFSEPGAGSDLASLATRAEKDGDEYVVTGQKVWTTGAQFADYAILVARTNPDQPKHKGLSYFALDMKQQGVEVRPLKEMTGGATFNEVFLSEARIPAANMIGEPGEGWRVTMTTLSHERDSGNPASGGGGGNFIGAPPLDLPVSEFLKPTKDEKPDGFELAMSGGAVGLPQQMASDNGSSTDPVVRQELMDIYAQREVIRLSGLRAKAKARSGANPGPESSTGKLMGSELGRMVRETGLRLEGPYGQLMDDDAPEGGLLQAYGLFQPAMSIAGGSDEIQRNIIGERVLGLPKEPDVGRDQPWRDLPR